MDTLAGYGSDSSDSSQGVGETKTTTAARPAGLADLLGGASSTSSEDEEDDKVNQVDKNKAQELPEKTKDRPSKKRSRIEQSFLAANQLPTPQLDDSSTSMVTWHVDYFLLMSTTTEGSGRDMLNHEYNKFERLAKSFNDTTTKSSSWANHLQNQHEFHNPHFFQSVVEYFGIKDPLGSHVVM